MPIGCQVSLTSFSSSGACPPDSPNRGRRLNKPQGWGPPAGALPPHRRDATRVVRGPAAGAGKKKHDLLLMHTMLATTDLYAYA